MEFAKMILCILQWFFSAETLENYRTNLGFILNLEQRIMFFRGLNGKDI